MHRARCAVCHAEGRNTAALPVLSRNAAPENRLQVLACWKFFRARPTLTTPLPPEACYCTGLELDYGNVQLDYKPDAALQ